MQVIFGAPPRDSVNPSDIAGWDIHDTNYVKELGISNRENGYRDIIAQIDLSSFRRIASRCENAPADPRSRSRTTSRSSS